jgi:hypothetical protein
MSPSPDRLEPEPPPLDPARFDHTHLSSHWTAQLPGWSRGRALLACYLTFDDEPAVHAVADAYQEPLRDLAALDLVRREWLHATVQGVWFVDALPPTAHRALVAALGDALADVPAPDVELTPPVVGHQGVYLPLRPVEGVARARAGVRAAVRDALGLAEPYVLPGQDVGFDPHVSLAYANDVVPVAEVRRRLDGVEHPPTMFTLRGVTVLCVERAERAWRWTDAVAVPLAVTGRTAVAGSAAAIR